MGGSKTIIRGTTFLAATAELRRARDAVVTVGVHGSASAHKTEEHHHDLTTGATSVVETLTPMAEVAAANEFGTDRIPERSFLRSTMDERREAIAQLETRLLEKVAAGAMPLEQALGILGQYAENAVKQKIASNIPPPNAPSTVAAKGSSRTLVDTGQLRASITYEVNIGGGAPESGAGKLVI